MHRLSEIAPGVLVRTSELYVTNSTVVAGPDGGCLVVDPGVTPADLDQLAADLTELGLHPVAGFATHPHWDHVLWNSALGDAPRYASRRAATVARQERVTMIARAEAEAPGHDPGLVGRLLPLDQDTLPWDGPDAQLVTHDGHAPGHSAIFLARTGTLLAGDMCSDIEVPLLDLDQADPISDYLAGLDRLARLPVRQFVPGHGSVGDAGEFRRRSEADIRYLMELRRGREPRDPRLGEDWLLTEHREQVERLRQK